MISFEFSERIEASPQVVFDYMTDQRNLPSWSPEVVSSEHVGGGPVHVGSRLRQARKAGKITMTSTIEVIAHEPPSRHAVRARVLGVEATFEFSFEPDGSGTRARLHGKVVGRWLGRLLEKKLGTMMWAADAELLGRLKRCVEAAALTSSPARRR